MSLTHKHERQRQQDRRARREIREVFSLIIHHQEPPDVEPRRRNPFMCDACGHVRQLCTCPLERTAR